MLRRLFSVPVLMLLLTACSNYPSPQAAQLPGFQQTSFERYVQETSHWLSQNRRFIGDDPAREVMLNAPFERLPDTPGDKAVLLVHGLTDSPYSFIDMADELTAQGYVVRTLLLPGHGSKPEDLMLPDLADWTDLVQHHTRLLTRDYGEVWLGGYSTGANLVTIEALQNQEVNGLLLFAPAFEPDNKMVALAPWLHYLVDWADQDPEENLVKYDSLPMKGAGVYYETSALVMDLLAEQRLDIPVFMAVSEADSVIDTDTVIEVFQQRFTGPKRLFWFGEQAPVSGPEFERYSMQLPQYRISNGSHMSLLFDRDNPLYGIEGVQRQCNNGQEEEAEALCHSGAEVWYSAWGYQEAGKVHARLTWNPYFDETMQAIHQLMARQ